MDPRLVKLRLTANRDPRNEKNRRKAPSRSAFPLLLLVAGGLSLLAVGGGIGFFLLADRGTGTDTVTKAEAAQKAPHDRKRQAVRPKEVPAKPLNGNEILGREVAIQDWFSNWRELIKELEDRGHKLPHQSAFAEIIPLDESQIGKVFTIAEQDDSRQRSFAEAYLLRFPLTTFKKHWQMYVKLSERPGRFDVKFLGRVNSFAHSTPSLAPEILGLLMASDDQNKRATYLDLLHNIGKPALPSLKASLQHPDSRVVRDAAKSIVVLGTVPDMLDILEKHGSDHRIAEMIFEAIATKQTEAIEARPALLKFWEQHLDRSELTRAVVSLYKGQLEELRTLFCDNLSDECRVAIAKCISPAYGKETALCLLEDALTRESCAVVEAALWQLDFPATKGWASDVAPQLLTLMKQQEQYFMQWQEDERNRYRAWAASLLAQTATRPPLNPQEYAQILEYASPYSIERPILAEIRELGPGAAVCLPHLKKAKAKMDESIERLVDKIYDNKNVIKSTYRKGFLVKREWGDQEYYRPLAEVLNQRAAINATILTIEGAGRPDE